MGRRWILTDEMVDAIIARLAGAPSSRDRPEPENSDDAVLEPVAGDSAEQRAAEARCSRF
jgi:hypothetical protein